MPDNAYDIQVYKGFRIVLHIDETPENPRTSQDNFGKMICFHPRYNLGDKHHYSGPDDLFKELCGRLPNRKDHHPVSELLGDGSEFRIVWEPLYLYDHSNITIATTPFSCPWDSGQVGIIYMTYQELAKALGLDYWAENEAKFVPSAEQIAKGEAILKGEVAAYDAYIRGDVFGFQIFAPADDRDDDMVESDDGFWMDDAEDSCWGFYGEEAALEAAKEAIDAIVDQG